MKQYIYAHRGASGYAPENTLEAFELAIQQGAYGVELDVHITADGHLVVAHDETVDRCSNGKGLIARMTLRELKALRFNKTFPEYANATIPTFREVLELVRSVDFDSLAHLTYPLRYFEGQHGVLVDLSRFSGLIDAILSEVIIRGRSLEVNSSGWRQGMGGPLPGRELLERYRKLGGWRITLGSDAHRTADLAADFVQTRRLLQELGFAGACHYRAGEPIFLPFPAEILPRVI